MSKLGKFSAACAVVVCAFGVNVARADALVPSGGDDTSAILDAITNATEGATVELGQGTFLLSSTLKFSRNVRLVGAGAGQTILDFQNKCRGISMTVSTAVLEGVTIKKATYGSGHGGGINMTNGKVLNCRITSCSVNNLNNGGGGIYMTGGTVNGCEIDHCTFGGLYGHGNAVWMNGGTVTNCDIHANNGGYNHSNPSFGAGIVYLQSGTLTCSKVRDNSKDSIPGIHQVNGTVINCLIYNNTGTYGAAGIYKENGYTYNCTIYNCVRTGDTTGESGFRQSNGTTKNCIVWDSHPASSTAGSVYVGGGTFANCVTEKAVAKATETATGDPKFVGAAKGDFRISTVTSSAYEHGVPLAAVPSDIVGKVRSTTAPTAGAYEFDGEFVVIPANPPFKYVTGETVTADIEDGEGYVVLENDGGVEPGTYPVIVGLRNANAHWADGTTGNKTLAFELVQMTTLYPTDSEATIVATLGAARPGEKICFAAGTFPLTKTLNLTNDVVLSGAGAGETILDFQKKCRGVSMTSSGAVVEGVTIMNAAYGSGNGGGINMTKGKVLGCRITKCTVSGNNNCGGGIYMTGGTVSGCEIDGCTFANLYGHGNAIYMNGGTVTNCDIHANNGGYSNGASGDAVVYLKSGTLVASKIRDNTKDATPGVHQENGTMINCLIYNNSGTSLSAGIYKTNGNTYNCTVCNCVLSGDTTGQSGLSQTGGTTKNCIVWGCHPAGSTAGSVKVSGGTFANGVTEKEVGTDPATGDPKFVNAAAGDFRISTATSPACEHGAPLAAVPRDFVGNVRSETAPTAGAYEFAGEFVGIPANPPFKYATGETLTADIEDGEGYVVVENEGGVEPGTYPVVVGLRDKEGSCWADGTTADKTLDFEILAPIVLQPTDGDEEVAAAIDATVKGGTLFFAPGTYALKKTINLSRSITLKGAGRDEVILNFGKKCRGVSMTAGGAVLEGVTISNCYVSVQNEHGGGVNMTSGTLRNCRVTSCSVYQLYSSGGGIYMTGGTVDGCEIDRCTFEGLYGLANAIRMNGGTVTNCDIHANNGGYTHDTVSMGSGIVCIESGTLTCTRIHDNSKDSVPGIYQKNGTVVNCLIYNNKGANGAAGIYKENGYTYNCTIYNCVRTGDTAGQSGISQSNGTTKNCIVWNSHPAASTAGSVSVSGGTFANNVTEVAVAKATDTKTGDPAFFGVVSNDFRITRSSSAYRTGVPLASVKGDFADVARDAEHPSIGAYEYDASIEVYEVTLRFDQSKYPQGADVVVEAVVTGVGDAELPVAWTLDGETLATTEKTVTLKGLPSGAHVIRAAVVFEGKPAAKEESFAILPTKVYVNHTGSGTYPYATEETGTDSFEAAFAALWGAADVTGEVVVAEGVYTNVTAVSFLNPIRVHGEGMDRTKILCKTRFVPFSLGNRAAILSGLTIEGGSRGASMSSGRIVGCRFLGCGNSLAEKSSGGGINMSGGTVADCRFQGCYATGLYGGGGGAYMTDGMITNCTFSGCQSGTDVANDNGGGAVLLLGGTVTHSQLLNSQGGVYPAFRIKGGTMRNVLVTGTKAGSTVAAYQDSGTIESCTIAGNSVLASTGTVQVAGGTFRNNIVWGNTGVCELVRRGASVDHCCYPEAKEGVDGNTAKDPLLKKGWVIKSCSPCRDAGADQPWMAGAGDLRGNPRICDDRVDIGCFEVRPSGLMLIVR